MKAIDILKPNDTYGEKFFSIKQYDFFHSLAVRDGEYSTVTKAYTLDYLPTIRIKVKARLTEGRYLMTWAKEFA